MPCTNQIQLFHRINTFSISFSLSFWWILEIKLFVQIKMTYRKYRNNISWLIIYYSMYWIHQKLDNQLLCWISKKLSKNNVNEKYFLKKNWSWLVWSSILPHPSVPTWKFSEKDSKLPFLQFCTVKTYVYLWCHWGGQNQDKTFDLLEIFVA